MAGNMAELKMTPTGAENDTYRIVDKGISSAGLSGCKAQVDGTEG